MEKLKPLPRSTPELHALIGLFHRSPEDLGRFEEVTADSMPEVPRRLLAHDEHMTVTVESHHKSPVDVRVVDSHMTASHYSREIVLVRQSDRRVVQFGIVRLNVTFLAPEIRAEIECEQTPLGRILIRHNVLRNVRLLSLWRIEPSPELVRLLELPVATTCFGRTALIYCNGIPAVELLEIVTPELN